mmetsp:Transcript_8645/g.20549  ORF Transcript_8645/g.20549 Transcript_8645/m.20549 type:complete len:487 (-) Transcript_8645:7-1467(-)
MSIFMSDGSFRQRAKCSEEATEAARETRRLKVALQTYETLRQFEETMQRREEAMSRAYDDIPAEALPARWTHLGSNASLGSHGSDRRLANATSEPAIQTVTLTHENGTEKDPRRLRPPSPLHFHDYGCITLKSRSKFLQHRTKLGRARPLRQTGHGFFVPGPHFKQGTYGDKLLDPCLMPQLCWVPPVQGCDTRRGPDALDLRPLSTPDLQVGRKKPINGEPSPERVRGNITYARRARRNNEAIWKRRSEALTEQRRFENGIFQGIWRDPLLDVASSACEPGPEEDFSWIPGAMEELMAGKSEEELGLAPARMNAFLLLIHLGHHVREGKTLLSKLFKAENRGPPQQLEIREFFLGVKRLGILNDIAFTQETLAEALMELDPTFDGRVHIPVLHRGITVMSAASTEIRKRMRDEEDSSELAYGETAPVRAVQIPKLADSINNFRKSFGSFRKQQQDLLQFHGSIKDLLNAEPSSQHGEVAASGDAA